MPKAHTHRILVIEDEPVLRSSLVSSLVRAGYEVDSAADAEEADKRLHADRICLVFLDILLPGRSGFDLLAEMRMDKQLKDLPVVILSQLGEKEQMDKARALGVMHYFVKANHSLQDIRDRVKMLLASCEEQTAPKKKKKK